MTTMQLESDLRDSAVSSDVAVIGAPIDIGGNRRGADLGPAAIRHAGLEDALSEAGVSVTDVGDVSVSESGTEPVDAIQSTTAAIADRVAETLQQGARPLVLGGDHSIAIGTLRGTARNAKSGVIWFDAHGDYNTPTTSPSGNFHGMPLAAAHGHRDFADADWSIAPSIPEENTVLVGLRSLDERERDALRRADVTAYTMADIDDRGISEVVDEAIDIAASGTDGVHVSLDLDWLDPRAAPGVGTPVPGGATEREAHLALERLAERDAADDVLRSMDVVEVNPLLDDENTTAEAATDLVASAFGNRII
ncbi:arginase [Haloterrigena sp. SYSU A121-1]|uniref:Arginase n=1 Tax=Haloterrigena gelatinilytica TaxID=2741724 RepID=A0A8J8GMX9_9EURY|nr:arginase [Haloterrigena gelatinilytica]NUB91329.1 arginase [Haloterrigena gelatinilytica]